MSNAKSPAETIAKTLAQVKAGKLRGASVTEKRNGEYYHAKQRSSYIENRACPPHQHEQVKKQDQARGSLSDLRKLFLADAETWAVIGVSLTGQADAEAMFARKDAPPFVKPVTNRQTLKAIAKLVGQLRDALKCCKAAGWGCADWQENYPALWMGGFTWTRVNDLQEVLITFVLADLIGDTEITDAVKFPSTMRQVSVRGLKGSPALLSPAIDLLTWVETTHHNDLPDTALSRHLHKNKTVVSTEGVWFVATLARRCVELFAMLEVLEAMPRTAKNIPQTDEWTVQRLMQLDLLRHFPNALWQTALDRAEVSQATKAQFRRPSDMTLNRTMFAASIGFYAMFDWPKDAFTPDPATYAPLNYDVCMPGGIVGFDNVKYALSFEPRVVHQPPHKPYTDTDPAMVLRDSKADPDLRELRLRVWYEIALIGRNRRLFNETNEALSSLLFRLLPLPPKGSSTAFHDAKELLVDQTATALARNFCKANLEPEQLPEWAKSDPQWPSDPWWQQWLKWIPQDQLELRPDSVPRSRNPLKHHPEPPELWTLAQYDAAIFRAKKNFAAWAVSIVKLPMDEAVESVNRLVESAEGVEEISYRDLVEAICVALDDFHEPTLKIAGLLLFLKFEQSVEALTLWSDVATLRLAEQSAKGQGVGSDPELVRQAKKLRKALAVRALKLLGVRVPYSLLVSRVEPLIYTLDAYEHASLDRKAAFVEWAYALTWEPYLIARRMVDEAVKLPAAQMGSDVVPYEQSRFVGVIREALEDFNYHTGAMQVELLYPNVSGGKVIDLWTQCQQLEREHSEVGSLTPELRQKQEALSEAIEAQVSKGLPAETTKTMSTPEPTDALLAKLERDKQTKETPKPESKAKTLSDAVKIYVFDPSKLGKAAVPATAPTVPTAELASPESEGTPTVAESSAPLVETASSAEPTAPPPEISAPVAVEVRAEVAPEANIQAKERWEKFKSLAHPSLSNDPLFQVAEANGYRIFRPAQPMTEAQKEAWFFDPETTLARLCEREDAAAVVDLSDYGGNWESRLSSLTTYLEGKAGLRQENTHWCLVERYASRSRLVSDYRNGLDTLLRLKWRGTAPIPPDTIRALKLLALCAKGYDEPLFAKIAKENRGLSYDLFGGANQRTRQVTTADWRFQANPFTLSRSGTLENGLKAALRAAGSRSPETDWGRLTKAARKRASDSERLYYGSDDWGYERDPRAYLRGDLARLAEGWWIVRNRKLDEAESRDWKRTIERYTPSLFVALSGAGNLIPWKPEVNIETSNVWRAQLIGDPDGAEQGPHSHMMLIAELADGLLHTVNAILRKHLGATILDTPKGQAMRARFLPQIAQIAGILSAKIVRGLSREYIGETVWSAPLPQDKTNLTFEQLAAERADILSRIVGIELQTMS